MKNVYESKASMKKLMIHLHPSRPFQSTLVLGGMDTTKGCNSNYKLPCFFCITCFLLDIVKLNMLKKTMG